ncbi:MAG: GntR family transcriptional regulator [Oenococcus sp.]|uniref:GntR family transcriptional regulator n=1 Tax=Oenococcus TaxID=46254 RepID=UPI00047F9AFA|nr:GntR family transcriptional regulator [Oenococcus kitaharae]MCV3296350.1 GntR family transcriptional regulator [Oenococcus kitaharae]OEY81427.1 GntR family transcriptional regulator [Oenococcus kitaharae]OEY82915.1 GntR family transcriptional regulator [Oenococcus kitaharae]OEY84541.1 GntR family transcriptional regulator [Oenococcus kitaharae]
MSSVPVFLRIRDDLAKRIDKQQFESGSRLPSERLLAQEYKVSRMTLRQATTLLVNQGKLLRKPGSGTYVSAQNNEVSENLKGVTSFTQIMRSQGKTAKTKFIFLKRHQPSLIEASNLEISRDQDVITMERVRYGDDEPIAYEITTVPVALVGNITRNEMAGGLYQYLEEKGFRFGKAIQEFSALVPNVNICKRLDLTNGQAALFLRQTSYLTDGKPFEFVQTYYAGDRYRVYLQRE